VSLKVFFLNVNTKITSRYALYYNSDSQTVLFYNF